MHPVGRNWSPHLPKGPEWKKNHLRSGEMDHFSVSKLAALVDNESHNHNDNPLNELVHYIYRNEDICRKRSFYTNQSLLRSPSNKNENLKASRFSECADILATQYTSKPVLQLMDRLLRISMNLSLLTIPPLVVLSKSHYNFPR